MQRHMSTQDVKEMDKDHWRGKKRECRGEDRRVGINSVMTPHEDQRIILDRRGLGKFLADRRSKGVIV